MTLITETGCRTTSAGNGWTPVLASVIRSSDNKTVNQVIDWVGGTGVKPKTGMYVGSGGFVNDIASATPTNGPTGPSGPQGPQGNQGLPGETPILDDDWFAI